MAVSLERFLESLTTSGLMEPAEVAALRSEFRLEQAAGEAEPLARKLVRQGKLTQFQAAELCKGTGRKLVLGNYCLLERIGGGGMGTVYKAEHRLMERTVALKVLPPSLAANENAVKRFQREVKTAARLSHPNIVTAHDAAEDGGNYFLVMQHIDGVDLSRLLKTQGALPLDTAVDYVLQAARGLHYAHCQGVVHRDVKPSNLLLDKSGGIHVSDLGLAIFAMGAPASSSQIDMTRLTVKGEMLGTADYISPEQAEDTRSADERSDIYSLGCTFYHLLTGRPPYAGDTIVQRVLAHIELPTPRIADRRSDAPEALEQIFCRMAAKQPADRYQTMAHVVDALEEYCGVPASVRTVSEAVFLSAAASDAALRDEATVALGPGELSDNSPSCSEDDSPRSTMAYQVDLDTHTSDLPQNAAPPRRKLAPWVFAALAAGTAALAAAWFLLASR